MPIAEVVPAEYEAALSGCAVRDASDREQVRVVGPESASFLQGMVTNDVEGLPVGGSCHAVMLTVKGSMVADVRVFRRAPDDFVVDTNPGRGATAKGFLEKYLISEDCELRDAPELAVMMLVGPGAKAVRASLPAGLVEGELVSPFGVDLLVQRAQLPALKAALAACPSLTPATFEVLRVEQGVPLFGVDMTEVTIPLEANLDDAIHYKKGCYVGQEVIARATFRGQMNKKLVRLLVGEATPEAKAELRVGERKVGWITSVVKSVKHGQHLALGYVHRDFLSGGQALDLGGAPATIAPV